mmetsp:Transcript_3842/g.11396  ORF Transcript_3842/g.11396 Transcript_3842/m.11396 type:complete len:231 (-) Transcript_3842:44-736(-)
MLVRGLLAVHDVLVHLVGDDEHPRVAPHHLGDRLHLARREDLTRRVVRRVEDDKLGPRPDGRVERVGVQTPLRLLLVELQRHRDGGTAREPNLAVVEVEGGLEQYHLVARVEQRLQREEQGLRGADRDCHLGHRVHLAPQVPGVTRSQHRGEAWVARRTGVLVEALVERRMRLGNHKVGRAPVREALPEVDRSRVLRRQRAELAPHGRFVAAPEPERCRWRRCAGCCERR